MTYCPAYVPVMVLDCPAASNPTAHTYSSALLGSFEASPGLLPKAYDRQHPAFSSSMFSGAHGLVMVLLWSMGHTPGSTRDLMPLKPYANTPTTNMLTRNETKSAIDDSIRL